MEGFIHIYNKNKRFIPKNPKIESIINNLKNTNHSFKIVRNETITGIYYTNEYSDYPYNTSENFLFCPVGQFVEDKNHIQDILRSNNYDKIRQTVNGLSGAFLLASVNLNNNSIDIYTHVVRAESVFKFEDYNSIIVGTDPLIVSAFSNENLQPQIDSSNFISYFEQGYFADENTPFYKVIALPYNSHINISYKVTINDMDDTYDTAFSQPATPYLLDTITTDFLNSFNIVKDKSSPILSGLTGGKDSRLILLALLDNNFNVHTHTTGFSDHPDVTVAQTLAKLLNVPHKINERKINQDNQYIVNLEKRIQEITSATSGLLSAYDSVSTRTIFKDNINFNGVGASVISGGFNNFNHNTGDLTMAEALKKALYKFDDFYLEKNNKYNLFLDEFSSKSTDYRTLLQLFFLQYRTGRWTSDSRIPKSYSSNSFSIFLDNQLTKSAMRLNMTDLRNEIIHYSLIKRLRPDILNVPFFNQRFAFEKNGPVSEAEYNNWLKREPIYAKNKIGSYNWRSLGNNDKNLINGFKELILNEKNNPVFDIVDYNKVSHLLNSKLTNRYNKFIWSIASMIQFSNSINNKGNYNNYKIKLDIPEKEIIDLNPPSKIMDLTSHYNSLNNSVIINPTDKMVSFINEDGYRYLKTHRGGFNTIPDSINISNARKIKFTTQFYILDDYNDIRMSVIFYNNNKRFKTIVLNEPSKNNQYLTFEDVLDVPKGAIYFRTTILFKTKPNSKLKLNYSYMELIY